VFLLLFLMRGQVWVETVIYTLIGLSVIGFVLSAALPKITERQDSIAIEQSIDALRVIDDKINGVKVAVGNRRIVDLDIDKGELIINADDDTISWVLDSSFVYSEIGVPVSLGRINVTTRKDDPYSVELKLDYDVDIRYDGDATGERVFVSSPTPYDLVIENFEIDEGKVVIKVLLN
jgi:type II secretory pathway pseudopilin PulG